MKVIFCLDDNPQYLFLLKAAVRSLRQIHSEVTCVCVYAGNNQTLMQTVEAEGITLVLYQPFLNKKNMAAVCHRVMGAFLRLELSLIPELKADKYVLYCDTDVYFHQSITALFKMQPEYPAMVREQTIPFFHEHNSFTYTYKTKEYTVSMPFPIWTYNSGVIIFNLDRLRRCDYVHNFLAFCSQVSDRIGNFDQSLLNYFFGKRIEKLDPMYNCPPYMSEALATGKIIHFHGPKPWNTEESKWTELRINHFNTFRQKWFNLLTRAEQEELKELK